MLSVSGPEDLAWRKSSRSGGTNDCVEVALDFSGAALRDSKNPRGGVLRFESAQWAMFLRAAKNERS